MGASQLALKEIAWLAGLFPRKIKIEEFHAQDCFLASKAKF